MKKILTAIILICLPALNLLAKDFTYEGINYTILSEADQTCKTAEGSDIFSPGSYVSGDVIIPSIVYAGEKAYVVTEIGACSFANNEGLTSVSIPKTVETIDFGAFENCSALHSVLLGRFVSSIGEQAFADCDLESITIPNSVTTIGNYAFLSNNRLMDVVCLPIVPPKCGYLSFADIASKCVLKVPAQSLDSYTEATISKEFSSIIPYDNVENADLFTYQGIRFQIKDSVENTCSVYDNQGATGDVSIPETAVFDGVPYKVTEIEPHAFFGCDDITSVTIPETITFISPGAFKGCNIRELRFNAAQCLTCGNIYNPAFDGTIESIKFGRNVRHIPRNFLAGGSLIQNLTIPSNVHTIGENAFANNNVLKSVTIGAGITHVSPGVFSDVPKIFWLANTPPDGYKQNRALANYTSNEMYDFGRDIKPIVYPFLSSMFEVDGVIYVPTSPSERTCDVIDCNYYATDDEVVIPAVVTNQGISLSVYNISDYAFYDNTYFSKLTLSELTNEIRNSAFYNCNKIESLTFPCGITAIEDYAFKNCTAVSEISFEDEKTKTEEVVLGSNSQQGLFLDCPVSKLYIGRKLNYPAGDKHGYSPFAYIKTLLDVEIADYEEKLDDYEFYMCIALKKLKVGNGVKSIGKWAFSGDYSLEYYSAGSRVESIGAEAFSDCTGVTEFYSYSILPPVCGEQSLDDINKWICTLYVPAQSSDEYMAATQWKDFFHIVEMEAPEVAEIRLDKTEASIKVGETLQLNATVLPAEASGAVLSWTSSDESIATVSETGLVTAVSSGTTTITVCSGNITGTCAVVVSEHSGIEDILTDKSVYVKIFNLKGILIYEGIFSEANLVPDYYIVVCDGKNIKVKVK